MKAEKILSLIIALVIPFPLLLTGIASTLEQIPPWSVFGGMTIAIAVWYLGRLMGILLKRAKHKLIYIVRGSFVLLGIITAMLTEILVFSLKMGALAPITIPFAFVLWYWFGFRKSEGQVLVTNIVLCGYGLEAVFMFPICRAFNEKAAFSIIILTVLITVLGALLINFRQVSNLSIRGKSVNKLLTKSCTRFNLKGTLIFCGVILFSFFFCGVGAKWLWEGIKAVVRFIIYLMGLFTALLNNGNGMEFEQGETASQITENHLGKVFLRIAYIVVAVVIFKPLVKAVKSLYRLIISKLGMETCDTAELNYTDIYEESDKKHNSRNTFKKAYKAFLREKETKKKFRLGYKAFMIGLNEKNLTLAPCDTPTDHLEKGRKLIKSPTLNQSVEKYSNVRYDDLVPAKEDCEVMKELLREVLRVKS